MPRDWTYSKDCDCPRCAARRQSEEAQRPRDWRWHETKADTRAIDAARRELKKRGFVNEWNHA